MLLLDIRSSLIMIDAFRLVLALEAFLLDHLWGVDLPLPLPLPRPPRPRPVWGGVVALLVWYGLGIRPRPRPLPRAGGLCSL